MAPNTVSGFTHGMAHGGHIRHENHEFTGIEGPTPTFAFSSSPNLHPGDLDPVAYDGQTLRTALNSSILEFTYIGGPVPSLIIGHGQVFRLGNQRPMAHGELTDGMATDGHILLGNHEIIRTDRLTPVTGLYPV
jgi:hypothetical protein